MECCTLHGLGMWGVAMEGLLILSSYYHYIQFTVQFPLLRVNKSSPQIPPSVQTGFQGGIIDSKFFCHLEIIHPKFSLACIVSSVQFAYLGNLSIATYHIPKPSHSVSAKYEG